MAGDRTPPRGSPLLVGARLLAAAGGMLDLAKAGPSVAGGVPGPASPMSIPPLIAAGSILAHAVVGVVGLAAALRGGASAAQVAGSIALAGALGLLLDLSPFSTPPRVIPGFVLLAAAAPGGAAGGRGPRTLPQSLARVAAGAGLVAPLLLIIPFLAIGLIVPPYGVLALYAIWGLMLALALRVRQSYPWLVPAIPPVTLAMMVGLLFLGGELLGWNA